MASYAAAMAIPCGVCKKSEADDSSSWTEPIQSKLVSDWLADFASTLVPPPVVVSDGM